MEEFISSLKEAQLETTAPTDITLSLLRFQTEINALFFHGWKTDDISTAFQEIWKFFLYAASHSMSSVRLAAYRATGSFLLKLSPYFTYIIQNTFSDISMVATIDVKSSAIVASSFAFISSRISLPYLDKFLDNTPVFHHFTISDPIFSEHLSSIISNLGELGFDWFSTLLHSFLAISETSKDRYLMKSITAVIAHDEKNLMNDFLQYVSDQNSYKKHLILASYIIITGHIYDDSFDLFNLARASIEVLQKPSESNPSTIDSAFQILSIKSPSFYLQVDPVDQDTINLTLSRKKPDQSTDLIDFDTSGVKKDDHFSIVIKVSVFKIRPTIYLLDLPLMYSEPTSEDGSLTLAAKFKSLASRINVYPEKTPQVLSTFSKYYNKNYDSTVSAVIQGISECFETLLKHSDINQLTQLIESILFTPCVNWFHSADVLAVIENMPRSSFEVLLGRDGLERVVGLLIGFTLSQNEQVSHRAARLIRKFVTEENFQKLTSLIASSIDVFDDYSLSHLLPLLNDILRDNSGEIFSHLHHLVFQLIELQDFYRSNLPVLTSLLHFIGNFTIDFVKIKILTPTFLLAVSIIAASIQCVSGFAEWENIFQFDSLSNMDEITNIISNDLKSKNIDVSSENALNYDEYLAPCVAALKFLYGIPTKMIQKDFILILYKKLRNIFPLDAAKFVQKFWPNFSDDEKIEALLKMNKSLRFVQNYSAASIISYLFIQIYKPVYAERLEPCKTALVHTANYALKNKKKLKVEEKTIFKAILFVTDEKSKNSIMKSSSSASKFESNILQFYPEIYTILFQKPNPNQKKSYNQDEIIDLLPQKQPGDSDSEPKILVNPYKRNSNNNSSHYNDFADVGLNNQSGSQIDLFYEQPANRSDSQNLIFSNSQESIQSDAIANSQPVFQTNSGNFNQNPGNFNQNSVSFNQNPGNFNQNPGNFNQNSSNFNQNSGNFSQNFGVQHQNNSTNNLVDDLFGGSPIIPPNNNSQPSFSNDLIFDEPLKVPHSAIGSNSRFTNDLLEDFTTTSPKKPSIADDLFGNVPALPSPKTDLFTDLQAQPNVQSSIDDLLDLTTPNTNNNSNSNLSNQRYNTQGIISDSFIYAGVATQPKPQTSPVNQNHRSDIILGITPTISEEKIEPSKPRMQKKYVFVKPPADLSKPLDPSNPLVKVQIKKSLRPFGADELRQILMSLSKDDDHSGVKLVLQYCLTNKIGVSVKGINFSEKSIPYVIRYLRLIKSQELEQFVAPFMDDETLPYQIYLQAAMANSSKYLKGITDSEKVKKIKMKNFGSIILSAQFQPSELIKAVNHCVSKAKSVRKLSYSLVLIQNVLMALREVPTDFVKSIFDLFEERINDLNYFTSCQILSLLSQKVPGETKITEYAIQIKSLISPSSPELYYVYQIIENMSKGSQIFSKEVPKTCDYLLNSHTPSIFVTGMLLFTFAQKKLSGDRLQSLMRHSFHHVTRRLTKTFKFYPIPELSTPSLVNVLNLPSLKKSRSVLVNSLDGIIPSINSASFETYSFVLPLCFSVIEEKQKFADEQAFIKGIRKSLLSTERVNTAFFAKLYLRMVKAKAETISPKPKQEMYMMKKVTKFFNIFQINCDFYELPSIIVELCSAVNAVNGFTQLLPIISDQIFANSPRFFPTFVGVALFVKKFRRAVQGNADIIAKMNASFVGAGKQMMAIHRSRGKALQLLADQSKIKYAIDLALFDDDCKESDLLIQKIDSI